MKNILVLNLGATSTKIAFYGDDNLVAKHNIEHVEQDLKKYQSPGEQLDYRKEMVLSWMEKIGRNIDEVNAFAIRGGRVKRPTVGGTYIVNETFKQEQLANFDPNGNLVHAGRMTLPLVYALADGRDIPIYFTDPATIDELVPEARLAGHPDFHRAPVFHALNQREVARRVAHNELGKSYEACNMVIAHMGGGVSVAAHQKGIVIDADDCTRGGGPFSPTRSGTLPMVQLVEACYSGKHSKDEVVSMIMGKGGVFAYLGTDDMREVERRIKEGDEKARLVFEAMAYQTAKEIGAYAAVLCGEVDAIVATGGIAHSERMTGLIRKRVGRFAPFFVYPGEYESEALAAGALRVLRGEEQPKTYA